jgi:hypothetical protein
MQRKRQKIKEGDEIAFLSRHFVALTCLYEVIGANDIRSHHSMVISGFLLELHEYYFWVTAGHCLKELDKLLASKGVRLHGGSFMDSFAYGGICSSTLTFHRPLTRHPATRRPARPRARSASGGDRRP